MSKGGRGSCCFGVTSLAVLPPPLQEAKVGLRTKPHHKGLSQLTDPPVTVTPPTDRRARPQGCQRTCGHLENMYAFQLNTPLEMESTEALSQIRKPHTEAPQRLQGAAG